MHMQIFVPPLTSSLIMVVDKFTGPCGAQHGRLLGRLLCPQASRARAASDPRLPGWNCAPLAQPPAFITHPHVSDQ